MPTLLYYNAFQDINNKWHADWFTVYLFELISCLDRDFLFLCDPSTVDTMSQTEKTWEMPLDYMRFNVVFSFCLIVISDSFDIYFIFLMFALGRTTNFSHASLCNLKQELFLSTVEHKINYVNNIELLTSKRNRGLNLICLNIMFDGIWSHCSRDIKLYFLLRNNRYFKS